MFDYVKDLYNRFKKKLFAPQSVSKASASGTLTGIGKSLITPKSTPGVPSPSGGYAPTKTELPKTTPGVPKLSGGYAPTKSTPGISIEQSLKNMGLLEQYKTITGKSEKPPVITPKITPGVPVIEGGYAPTKPFTPSTTPGVPTPSGELSPTKTTPGVMGQMAETLTKPPSEEKGLSLPSGTSVLPPDTTRALREGLPPSPYEDVRKAMEAPGTTPIEGMAEALKPGAAAEPGRIDIERQTIGITEPTKIESIKKEIGEIENQISTLQWQLNLIPGLDTTQKTAFENMALDWAKAGMSAEMIAEVSDIISRADADKISNRIMPTINKYLSENPEIIKAKNTLEELYTKYTAKEGELNSKADEMNKAVMAIQQSPYLTQSMIVGRTDRMRDEYNMEISRIQNELNTMGKDIDRGRDALKTLTTEGWKLAEADIGAIKLGVQEDVMGRMPFGYQNILAKLKAQPGGLYGIPKIIGAGQFGWSKKGYQQVTPFRPETPTAKAEKQALTEEYSNALKGLINESGFVPIDQFLEMMETWMEQTGDYNSKHFLDRFSREFVDPDERMKLDFYLGGYNI